MALGAVLVDRARRLRTEPAPVKVEGSTSFVEIHSPWFKARLTLPANPETVDPGGHMRTPLRPSLLFGVKDTTGDAVEIAAADRIEVDSPQLGKAIWEVSGEPEPLRKKRRVLGYQVALTRVEDYAFEARRGGSATSGGGDAVSSGGGVEV